MKIVEISYAALKQKCIECKKPLIQGSYWILGSGPYCNGHALQIQFKLHKGPQGSM